MIKLFVGGFPLDMEELALAQLFAVHGDIVTVKIVRDKKTRKCKGYAFIEMSDITGAEAAVEALNGTLIAGKTLSVSIRQEQVVPAPKIPTTSFQTPAPRYEKVQKARVEEKKKRPRRTSL